MDKSNAKILLSSAQNEQFFLTDWLKKIAGGESKQVKSASWDENKNFSVRVANLLFLGQAHHKKYGLRISQCAAQLVFHWVVDIVTDELQFKLKKARFCRVRTCPICQWRRQQMWLSRFFSAFPRIYTAHPTVRYVLLTLTVKNCLVSELRSTVQNMNAAWQRLTQRKIFPALGFVRSLEVTKEKNLYAKDKNGRTTKHLIREARPDYAHPHFHVILALPASYFGRNYLSTNKWAELWQHALRIDYTPICDVRCVKVKENVQGNEKSQQDAVLDALRRGILETIKYNVKPADMIENGDWLLTLVDQLDKTRSVALGGVFKDFLKEIDAELVDDTDDTGENGFDTDGLCFGWREFINRYQHQPAINSMKK